MKNSNLGAIRWLSRQHLEENSEVNRHKTSKIYGDHRGRRGSRFQSDSWDVSSGNECFIV